jgi:hypothetical protein
MEISVWNENDWLNDQSLMERKDKNEGYFVSKVLEKYREDTPSLTSIEIETVNRCNGKCSFCPVSAGNDRRPYSKMSGALFHKIINDLAAIDYSGFVSLFSNNEPLLDERFLDFLAYAKRRLPAAKHALFTNGSKLTRENFAQMTMMLDYLYIDNYSDDLQVLPHLNWLISEKPEEGNCRVTLLVRKKTQILNNRGGNAPNKRNDFRFGSSCILPFMQMVVRPDGKLSLCCQDAYGDMMLGDLTRQSVREAWEGETYQDVRCCLNSRGRGALQRCEACDIFGFHNYFPAKWVDDYARILIDKVWSEMRNGKSIYVCPPDYNADRIVELLRYHGIYKIKETTEHDPELRNGSAFIIFTSYCWELLERIDPENKLIGEKYVVFQNLEDSQLGASENHLVAGIRESFRKVVTASGSGNLAVFGAGRTAEQLVSMFGLNVQYYFDNNEAKQKAGFSGKPVLAPIQYSKGDLILLASMDENGMRNQLIDLGVADEMIVSGRKLL